VKMHTVEGSLRWMALVEVAEIVINEMCEGFGGVSGARSSHRRICVSVPSGSVRDGSNF
jgi:hypothetical protein